MAERKDKIHLKVAGARRTGTNITTQILQDLFSNEAYILRRSKHTPLDEYEQWISGNPDWHSRIGARKKISHILADRWKGVFDGTDKADKVKTVQFVKRDCSQVWEARYKKNLIVVVCVKDPYSWIVSYQKYMGIPYDKIDIESWCKMYNEFYRASLASLSDCPKIFLSNEMIMSTTPKDLKDTLEKLTGLQSTRIPDLRRGKNVSPHRSIYKNQFLDENYYLNKHYFKELNSRHLNTITDTIQWEIFESMGYKPVEKVDE